MKKYKLIHLNVVENLLSFLDECLEQAISNGMDEVEDRELVRFCEWGIKELANAKDGIISEGIKDKDLQKKMDSRWDKIDEKFFDWKLPPEMSEKEFEKMLNQFDAFLRGWEKEYNKKHPDEPAPDRQAFNPPHIEDVAEYMSLDEIQDYLLEDNDLTDEEAFEMYYDERERRKRVKEAKSALSYDELLKKAGIYNPKQK
tara:strand:+ start:286 stop:885 length:600 start_codon:yes stop_codon:yes gene_type:complete